jgi:threonine synthase
MKYYSTNKKSPIVVFREAVLNGQPPDKGLYFPEKIPILNRVVLKQIREYSKEALAFELLMPYLGSDIPKNEVDKIIGETMNFNFPLVQITDRIYVLELFHGPTLAFKDVGARFLSRCLGYFNRDTINKTIVLVATSGDTGGAVANAFSDVEGVHVVILYPAGKVSQVQELQLTTCGDHVSALQVSGDFDDCQRMVKMAFADEQIKKRITLTSANSINIARWLPQQCYYAEALRQWIDEDFPVFSVPCGNLGNISAGLLAMKSLNVPIRFIAACNENNALDHYIKTGSFLPEETIATISNAMDVGAPSNFPRILELYEHNINRIRSNVSSDTISDKETKEQILTTYQRFRYITDPHGAVAMKGLENYLELHRQKRGIFLETAHAVKFPDVVEPLINNPVPIPPGAKSLNKKERKSIAIGAAYPELQEFLQKM